MLILPKFSAPIMAFFLLGSLNTLTPSHSFAAVTFGSGYGVSAGASTASDCPSFCTGDFEFDSNGGEFAGLASATSTLYGTSQSQAFYSSTNSFLPELKAFSSSTAGRGGTASAFGVQGYAYEGTETRQITIEFELDANVIDSGTFGAESASAAIGVLGVDSFDPNEPVEGPMYFADFGTWYFENFGTQLGTDSLFVNSPNGSDIGSISFNVDPGDVFFVGASLRASSRTGTADAFNTFTSTFSDPAVGSLLTIANPVAAVPEPTTLAFVPMVVVGLIGQRRNRTVV